MTRAAIVGASGYAGRELASILSRHSRVQTCTLMSARADAEPARIGRYGFAGPLDVSKLANEHDVVFTCLPHAVGSTLVRDLLAQNEDMTVVDLSADHRFRDAAQYERVYGIPHPTPETCDAARYGLTEHDRQDLAGARLVANPGCYPTATLLALLPLVDAGLVRSGSRVVVDAKSGVSGAGKKPSDVTLYGNVNENFRAYGVGTHRHAPEIASRYDSDLELTFVPHLVPMFRGMLATLYLEPSDGADASAFEAVLRDRYSVEPFVHVVPGQPCTADVSGTNECHLSVADAGGAVVVTSAIDNLVKGAAGQAVQNMNAVLGFDEPDGLGHPLLHP